MSALAMTILALLTLSPGNYARHIRDHSLPPQHRAQQLADHVEHAAFSTGLPRALLTAHWYYESTLHHRAMNRTTKAFGIGQLMPTSIWHKGWLKSCARDSYACEVKDAEYAAVALKYYKNACGTVARALTAYRVGHCAGVGPKAKTTLRLAKMVQERMNNPSLQPLRAPRF